MGRMRNPIRALALLVLSLTVPVEARAAEPREVRPHPCRVPGYEQDVLCATYPVWENCGTRQGRKIGLNIVMLPALGPDKQPDPVFELGGGPGQGIAERAGRLALVVPRGGHGGRGDCIENLIRDFIDRASVQGLDTSCVADINGPVTFMLP